MGTPADEAVTRQVEQAIGFNPRVNVFDVRVEVRDGVAHLQGIVQSLEAKLAAGEAAAATPGVRRVDNTLTVEDPRGLAGPEMDQAVEDALDEDARVNPHDVGAHVTDSVAHLVGHVDSVDDEQAAIHAASRAEGVKEVVSELDISPGRDVDWVDIKNAVTDALDAAGGFYPQAIDVSVETDGRVVLSGSAGNDHDRERAVRIAGRVDGVKEVVDRLSG